MKALVTGFDPFDGDPINPSYEAVRRLPTCIGTLDVVTAQLPTSFKRATVKLRALLRRERPDIVLCDVHMTPVDGQEFLHRVRESDDPAVRDVAMIFLSGDNQLDTVRGAMRHHADGYLVKPFEVEDLKQQLDITVTILGARRKAAR